MHSLLNLYRRKILYIYGPLIETSSLQHKHRFIRFTPNQNLFSICLGTVQTTMRGDFTPTPAREQQHFIGNARAVAVYKFASQWCKNRVSAVKIKNHVDKV